MGFINVVEILDVVEDIFIIGDLVRVTDSRLYDVCILDRGLRIICVP